MFALKMGLGFGGALSGILLSAFGYVSGGTAMQSSGAVEGIRLVSSIVPAVVFGIALASVVFYPITKRFNEKMQAELAERRKAAEGQGE